MPTVLLEIRSGCFKRLTGVHICGIHHRTDFQSGLFRLQQLLVIDGFNTVLLRFARSWALSPPPACHYQCVDGMRHQSSWCCRLMIATTNRTCIRIIANHQSRCAQLRRRWHLRESLAIQGLDNWREVSCSIYTHRNWCRM